MAEASTVELELWSEPSWRACACCQIEANGAPNLNAIPEKHNYWSFEGLFTAALPCQVRLRQQLHERFQKAPRQEGAKKPRARHARQSAHVQTTHGSESKAAVVWALADDAKSLQYH